MVLLDFYLKTKEESPLEEGMYQKSIAQQQKAKMPAAGATQALRLFCKALFAMVWHRKHKRECVPFYNLKFT
jgi:hypothetical protein